MGTAVLFLSAAPVAAQNGAYTMGAQDVVMVTVFNHPTMTGRYNIDADGTLTFPLVGRVPAAGLTSRQLETSLVEKLAEGYLVKPQVSVTVVEYKSQQCFVMGEVRQPGPLFLTGQETLLQALARAGSTTPDASSEIMVVRPKARLGAPVRPDQVSAGEIMKIDLDALSSGALQHNVALQDGDTIFVPRAEPVYILGQVRTPGPYRLTNKLTVLQLLSMAGGVTERGATNRIKITRLVNGVKKEIKAGLNDLLKPNDTVTVPEKWF